MKTSHMTARNVSAFVLSVSVIVLSFPSAPIAHRAHLLGLVLALPG